MFIKYFKSKYRLSKDSEERGYQKGIRDQEKIDDKKIKGIIAKYERILNKKNILIKKLGKRVTDIDDMIKNSTSVFLRAEMALLKATDVNMLTFRRATKSLSKNYHGEQDLLEDAATAMRTARKVLPKIEHKIEKTKLILPE